MLYCLPCGIPFSGTRFVYLKLNFPIQTNLFPIPSLPYFIFIGYSVQRMLELGNIFNKGWKDDILTTSLKKLIFELLKNSSDTNL